MNLRENWPQIFIVWLLLNAIGLTMLHNARDNRHAAMPSDVSRSEPSPALRLVQ